MAWLMSILVSFYFFYQFIQINILNGMSEVLIKTFQLSPEALSQISGLFFLPIVFLALPAGFILDRYPIKRVILSTLLLSVLGVTLMGTATTSGMLALGRLFTGIAHGFCFLSCMRFATGWMPPQQLAAATGWIVSIGVLGGMMAQTPLSWLMEKFSWRQAFYVDAALGLIFWLVFWFYLQDPPRRAIAQDSSETSSPWASFAAFKSKNTWLTSIVCCCLNTPLMVIGALWGNVYLTSVHHLTDIQASFACSLIFIGSVLGSPVVGWLSDHFQVRKPGLYWTGVGSILCMLPLFYFESLTPWALNLLFLGLGLMSAGMVIGYAIVGDSNRTELTATAFALNSIVIMGGSMVFQNLFGHLVGSLESPHFKVALLSIFASFFVGLIATFLLDETYPRTK